MGLDSVELVLQVEDAFGFSIPEEEAADMTTVGKLYDYVLAHRFRGKQDACLSSVTFYKIRRALMSALKIPRHAVRVSTDLQEIIPNHRRRAWRAIADASSLRLPILQRPRWIVMIATLTAIALGAATSILLGLAPFRGGVMVAILSAGVFGYALFWLTTFLAYEFPRDVATVGQLAKATLARNYQPIVAEVKKLTTDAEIWDILRRIVGQQLGVQPDLLTKETNFVKDLHVD